MNCLNCNTEISGAFCANCGQPSSAGRFTIHNIFAKVSLYVFLILNKGVLYTISQLFVRPGHSTREYIQGQRVRMTDYFTLTILICLAIIILDPFSADINITDLQSTHSKEIDLKVFTADEFFKAFENLTNKFPRLVVLLQIPFLGLCSYLWFRKRSKQNFAENLVLNFYRTSGELLFSLVFAVLCIFIKDPDFLSIVLNSLSYLVFLYTVWFYYQYYSAFGYRKSTLLIRSILAYVTGFLLYFFMLSIIIGLRLNYSK